MTREKVKLTTTTLQGMDSYSDSTTLPDGMCPLIQNMRLLKGIAYTREGWTKYNSSKMPDVGGVNSVHGIGQYLTDINTPYILAVSNGYLYRGSGGTMTQIASGLNATNLCSIVQTQDVALVVDGASGILAYEYGLTPFFVGINTPQIYRLIDSFENVSAWTVTNGVATADTGHFIHGLQSINFYGNVSATMTVSQVYSVAYDLTGFPDGSSSSTSDYISIYFLRGDPTTFTSCNIRMGDGAGSYYYYNLAGDSLWTGNSNNYVAFTFNVAKSAFSSSGTPNWNNIKQVDIIAVASGAVHPSMTLDFLCLIKRGPTTATGAAGVLNGTYYYKMTFLNAEGDESEGSLVSNSVVAATQKVTLTTLPISGSSRIVRRRLYRVGGTSTIWRLVYQFEDNIQTGWTDNVADSALGDSFTDIRGIPFIPQCICIHGDYIVIANLTTQDGIYYPDGVMISEEGSYEIFNVLNFFEFEAKVGTRVMWLHSEFGKVYAGKEDSIWSFVPEDLSIPPVCESRLYGGVGVNGVCSGENCFFYSDRQAIVMCTGTTHLDISTPWIRNFLDSIPDTWRQYTWMRYFDHTLYVGIAQQLSQLNVIDSIGEQVIDAGSENVIENSTILNATILAYYTPTKQWYTLFGWDAIVALSTFAPAFGRHLYLGATAAGYIYDAFTGTDDDGVVITTILQTKDSDFGEPETLKDYDKLILTGESLTGSTVALTVTPFVDRLTTGLVVNGNQAVLNASGTSRLELPVPSSGGPGTYLGVQIVSVGRWIFRSLTQVVRLREPTY